MALYKFVLIDWLIV